MDTYVLQGDKEALLEEEIISTDLGVVKTIPKGPSNNMQKIAEKASRQVKTHGKRPGHVYICMHACIHACVCVCVQ